MGGGCEKPAAAAAAAAGGGRRAGLARSRVPALADRTCTGRAGYNRFSLVSLSAPGAETETTPLSFQVGQAVPRCPKTRISSTEYGLDPRTASRGKWRGRVFSDVPRTKGRLGPYP